LNFVGISTVETKPKADNTCTNGAGCQLTEGKTMQTVFTNRQLEKAGYTCKVVRGKPTHAGCGWKRLDE